MIVFRAYTTVEYDMTYEFRVDNKEELIETLTDIVHSEERAREIAEGAELEGWEGEELLYFLHQYDTRVDEQLDNEVVSSVHIEGK
jgi:hypothetical protein